MTAVSVRASKRATRRTDPNSVSPSLGSRNNRNKAKRTQQPRKSPKHVEMLLSKSEKIFLFIFTLAALMGALGSALAIFLDKHAIVGSEMNPSLCLLSDTDDCKTHFESNTVRIIVAASARVDLALSIFVLVSGVFLNLFRMFNGRILIVFLLIATLKFIIITVAIVLIVTDGFYYTTLNTVLEGFCGDKYCVDDDRMNIVAAFFLLLGSGISTTLMMFVVFTLGSYILRIYEESHFDDAWLKWEEMMQEMQTH